MFEEILDNRNKKPINAERGLPKKSSVIKKVGKSTLKTIGKILGPAYVPIAAYDIQQKLKEGATLAEALEYGVVGTELLPMIKEQVAKQTQLTPEEVEAQALLFNEDMGDMGYIQGPPSGMTMAQAQEIYDKGIARILKGQLEDKEGRLTKYQESLQETLPEIYGYKDGGKVKDPLRRKVIQGILSLAALPIVGKYIKLAKPAAEVGIKATQVAGDYAGKALALAKKLYDEGFKTMKRGENVYTHPDRKDIQMIEDIKTGERQILFDTDKGTKGSFIIKKGEDVVDEASGKYLGKSPDEVLDVEEVYKTTPDGGYVKDLEEGITGGLENIDEFIGKKKGFANGGLTDTIPPQKGPDSRGVESLFRKR